MTIKMLTSKPSTLFIALSMLITASLLARPVIAQDVTPPPPVTDKTTQKDVDKIRNSVTRIQGIGMEASAKQHSSNSTNSTERSRLRTAHPFETSTITQATPLPTKADPSH
jgi:hypothetical protein